MKLYLHIQTQPLIHMEIEQNSASNTFLGHPMKNYSQLREHGEALFNSPWTHNTNSLKEGGSEIISSPHPNTQVEIEQNSASYLPGASYEECIEDS